MRVHWFKHEVEVSRILLDQRELAAVVLPVVNALAGRIFRVFRVAELPNRDRHRIGHPIAKKRSRPGRDGRHEYEDPGGNRDVLQSNVLPR